FREAAPRRPAAQPRDKRLTPMPVGAAGSFFFQAEDGIRDRNVTGVQTCALPILLSRIGSKICDSTGVDFSTAYQLETLSRHEERSEERRVGKECRSGMWSCG